jgi:hypothetical protein
MQFWRKAHPLQNKKTQDGHSELFVVRGKGVATCERIIE